MPGGATCSSRCQKCGPEEYESARAGVRHGGGDAGGIFQIDILKTFCKNAEFAVPPTRIPCPPWPADARLPVPLPSTAESPARRPCVP